MRSIIDRFQRSVLGKRNGSKEDAKQRLKILLIHDQVDLTQAQLDNMKSEIMEIVGKYLEVDSENILFKLDRDEGEIALVGNFPVRRVTGARA